MELSVLTNLWLLCVDKNPVATVGSLEERNSNKEAVPPSPRT